MSTKPLRQLELVAIFLNPPAIAATNPAATLLLDGSLLIMPVTDLAAGSDAAEGVRDSLFAEVNIPHHTADAIYGYTFHIFNRLNHEPAIAEATLLQQEIERVHARYAKQTQAMSWPMPHLVTARTPEEAHHG